MPYCKNCGAYIPTDDTKCDECGTMNGKTPLMRLQRAIKTNSSLDDIIEKPEIDNRPIAMPKEPHKQEKKDKQNDKPSEPQQKEEDLKSKFSDYIVNDIPEQEGKKEVSASENISLEPPIKAEAIEKQPIQNTIIEPLSDLDADFDMFGALGLDEPQSTDKTNSSIQDKANAIESSQENVQQVSPPESNNTDGLLDDIDDLDDFIEKHTNSNVELSEDYKTEKYQGFNNYEDYVNGAQKEDKAEDTEKAKMIFTPAPENNEDAKSKEPHLPTESPVTVEASNKTEVPAIQSSDVKAKKKSKLPIILVAILVVILAGYITITKTSLGDKIFKNDNTTTVTLAGAVTTTNGENTTIQVTDAYSYADVYQATGIQAAQAISGIVNGYQCGKINSVTVDGEGKVTLKTDEWEILFRVKNPAITKEAFLDKSVMVVGSALYNSISAEKVYIYNSSDPIEISTTAITTTATSVSEPVIIEAPTDAPTEPPTEAPTENPTAKPTTTKKTTTRVTTTAIPVVAIEYISESKAKQLMSSWRADGTKLGDSNAYYGTIKSVSANGDNIIIKTAKFTITFKSTDTINQSLVGKNILAVAKPQSDNTVRASQVYIY